MPSTALEANTVSEGWTSVPARVLLRDLERHLSQMQPENARASATSWVREAKGQLNGQINEPLSPAKLNEFVRLCVQGRLHHLLAAYRISHPSYNILEHFDSNAPGPWDAMPTTWRATTPAVWSVLGFDVAYPIGVPASVLTATPDWVEYYARQGFNVITFKTVRSRDWPAHSQPNWVFLAEQDRPFALSDVPDSVRGDLAGWPANPRAFSTANSFGVPSFTPETWQADVAEAKRRLRSDQLLIVSVMGTSEKYRGDELVADFVTVGKLAFDAGAQAIELNLSCPNTVDPNTGDVKGPICASPADTAKIVGAVREAIPGAKLVAKLSYLNAAALAEVVTPLLRSNMVDGISGINTVQLAVVRSDGTGQVFPKREKAGVSGVAIRDLALDFVRNVSRLRHEINPAVSVLGMGGVMTPTDVQSFLDAGADAVQTATAAFFNPSLPTEIQDRFSSEAQSESQLEASGAILGILNEAGPLSVSEVADRLRIQSPPDWSALQQTNRVLRRLEKEGLVSARRDDGRSVYVPASDDVAR